MNKFLTIATLVALAVPALCSGQDPLGPTRLGIDRAELTSLLDQYDASDQSTAHSDVLRDEVRAQADLIRARLRVG